MALDAESWITPPPPRVDRNSSGRPRAGTSQSSTRVSTSVQAGLVAQSIPWTPRPVETRSPSTDGSEAFDGKKAKKSGDCQWVTPGRTISSRSRRRPSKPSPDSGAASGSMARMLPGSAWERTGCFSTVSR